MGMRSRSTAVLLCLAAIPCGIAQTQPGKSEAAALEIQQGDVALRQGRFQEAKQHFERAEQLSEGSSAQIDAGIAIAELQMGHYEAARQRESRVLSEVSESHQKAEAYNIIGTAWLRESGENGTDMEKLRAAERAFQQAVELDPAFDAAYFNLGNTLLRQKVEAEASAAFKNSIDASARNPLYQADLPAGLPAPNFKVTDNAGRVVSSESLRGRCVLLDFWATWCPPCIRALPVIRELGHYFPSDQFVLVSVNEDSDTQKWRAFIALQKMDWTQVWDQTADLYHVFGLAPRPDLSIPRYILLDGRGYIRRVYDGTDRLGQVTGQTVRLVTAEAKPAAQVGQQPSPPAPAEKP
jgi:tetratricopeptide (TPR) repeat protein